MEKYVGQSVKRKEDYRLLTGKGQFVADIHLADMLEAAILRSTYAHANIKNIDTSEAKALPGVHAVITAEDIDGEVEPFTRFIDQENTPPALEEMISPVIKPCPEEVLAKGRVFYVGQPVAVVVAEDRYIAEDALALIKVDYEPLPVVIDPDEAVKEDALVIHEHLGSNVQAHYDMHLGDVDKAFEEADHVLKGRYTTQESLPIQWKQEE